MWEGECVEKMTKLRDGGEREREGEGDSSKRCKKERKREQRALEYL